MRWIAIFVIMCAGCSFQHRYDPPPVRRVQIDTSMKVTTDGFRATGCAGVGASYSVTW
jgi:hypothetical protein